MWYLCAASRVLRCTASNEHGIVVFDQIIVKTEVLLFGQDGVVGFETVLLEQLLISVLRSVSLTPAIGSAE